MKEYGGMQGVKAAFRYLELLAAEGAELADMGDADGVCGILGDIFHINMHALIVSRCPTETFSAEPEMLDGME